MDKVPIVQRELSSFRRGRRSGFSLVEILVAIAIIALLLGLLLPAVQSAREVARRLECMNSQRSLAHAALVHETARRALPVGAHNSEWVTWLVALLPHIEETAISDVYDKRPYLPETRFNAARNAASTTHFFPLLVCPSDGSAVRTTMAGSPSAHNYVACTGNGVYVATPRGWLSRPPRGIPGVNVPQPGYGTGWERFRGGAYMMSGADENLEPAENPQEFRAARAIKVREIIDGTTNTLAFSETIRRPGLIDGLSPDWRGCSWWGPTAFFTTIVRPNEASNPDTMPGDEGCGGEPWYVQPRCWGPHDRGSPIMMAARSRHPGGVVASRVDTSTHFYDESIDSRLWENLGTAWGQDSVEGRPQ